MASQNKTWLKKNIFLALFISISLVLFIFDSLLPKPMPFFRLGLANIIILLVLVRYGWQEALLVSAGKVVLGALFTGTLLNFAFMVSACATLVSTILMIGVLRAGKKLFSLLGVSVLGAFTHNMVQLAMVWLFLFTQDEILLLLPFFSLSSVFTGIITGWLALILLQNRRL